MKRLLFVLALTLILGCTTKAQQPLVVDEQLSQDIGEMLLVGFRGQHAKDCAHLQRDLQQYHVGSVILFEYDAPSGRRHRNISSPRQLQQLCSELQQLAGGSLLIGIDQEGGRVARMRKADGFQAVLSPEASAGKGLDTVRREAELTAQMLRTAGVNFNFAPVADVNVNAQCPIIGKLGRSFSADTAVVTDCCSIWIREQKRQRIVSCLKHFPGHGSASGDTHAGIVDVSRSWQTYELAPYRTLIASGQVDAVMVAHVINGQIDPAWPASLSRATITGLLRQEMGFQGVVVTDDLAMGAIINQYDFDTVICRAIQAGNDLLCLSNNGSKGYDPNLVPQTVATIVKLIEQGSLTKEQIHQAAERVRDLKRKIGLLQ